MSDVSEAALQRRNEELTAELATTRGEAKKYRNQRSALSKQVEALTGERDTLLKDRDAWKTKAEAGPSELKAKVAELEGTIRTTNHKAEFAKLAKAEGVRDEAVDDLWTASGYKAEADQFDDKAVKALITTALETRGYMLDDGAGEEPASGPSGAKDGAKALLKLQGALGTGRGDRDTAGRTVVKKSDLQNAAYALAPENQKRLAEANAAGNLSIVDR